MNAFQEYENHSLDLVKWKKGRKRKATVVHHSYLRNVRSSLLLSSTAIDSYLNARAEVYLLRCSGNYSELAGAEECIVAPLLLCARGSCLAKIARHTFLVILRVVGKSACVLPWIELVAVSLFNDDEVSLQAIVLRSWTSSSLLALRLYCSILHKLLFARSIVSYSYGRKRAIMDWLSFGLKCKLSPESRAALHLCTATRSEYSRNWDCVWGIVKWNEICVARE